ncbi:Probable nitrite transporter [Actinomyces bovis]|uniref:Probable nitrite transporter n=1 Tax=Actinomyces bovis TaxID=1658 RepID=A0ABY1VSV6_9ACTO|nr:formate/nitrite transporter family protein [Actinomyces bovis]SPT55039.1 Probable nitrite transporter [Actinomyces bovis]VEG56198.1 Probable nitrite transporter [Actinomyces israelii]
MLTLTENLQAQAKSAVARTDGASRLLPFLVSSMLAGAFVGIGGTFMLMAAGPFKAASSPATALISGPPFCVGLLLCIYGGAELGTSAMMTFAIGSFRKAITWLKAGRVLLLMLLGNLAGSMLLAALLWGTNILNSGNAAGAMLAAVVTTKGNLPLTVIFFRGIMCNILVCLTIWCVTRLSSEVAKAVAVFAIISAFVTCGFEHVVANMTFFSLGLFYGVDGASVTLALRNLLVSGIGNLVGGAIFVGAAYLLAARTEQH